MLRRLGPRASPIWLVSELVIYGLVSNSLVVKFGTAVHSAPGNERRLHCGGGYSNLAAAKGIASNLPGSNQPRTLGDPLDALERWDATRLGPCISLPVFYCGRVRARRVNYPTPRKSLAWGRVPMLDYRS